MIDEHFINKKLEQLFGAQNNKANFRLARTNDQYEYRRISDNVIEQLPKYNYLPRGYWVIERLLPVDGVNAEMLPGAKLSYEPIFVFRNPRNDEPIPVVEDIVIALVHSCLFAQANKTKRDWDAEELAAYQKQVDKAYEFISDECSVMSTQLHLGEAVVKGEAKI
jgi:hypothetical protein